MTPLASVNSELHFRFRRNACGPGSCRARGRTFGPQSARRVCDRRFAGPFARARPHPAGWRSARRGDGTARRKGKRSQHPRDNDLRHVGALFPLWTHCPLRRGPDRGGAGQSGGGPGGPQSQGGGSGPGRHAPRRHRSGAGPDGRSRCGTQYRIPQADAHRPALCAPEVGQQPGWPHGPSERAQPMDHRRGRAPGQPGLAPPGRCSPDRRRHRAG